MAKSTIKKVEAKSVKILPEIKKSIENHKEAAHHFEMASKMHSEASRHFEEGNHARAHEAALFASGHAYQALDIQKADAKHHALTR